MPMINIEYDRAAVAKESVVLLSESVQKIVSEVTNIEDVFVYANSAEIMIKAAPIEIFVHMSHHKISSPEGLTNQIKDRLVEWKSEHSFDHPINLTLIPMQWVVEVGI